jgi:hypothetical protein
VEPRSPPTRWRLPWCESGCGCRSRLVTATRTALPRPPRPEPTPVLRDHGLRLDDHERGTPARRATRVPAGPEELVGLRLRGPPPRRARQHLELVAEREALELELGPGPNRGSDRTQQGDENGQVTKACPRRFAKINPLNKNRFLAGTTATFPQRSYRDPPRWMRRPTSGQSVVATADLLPHTAHLALMAPHMQR